MLDELKLLLWTEFLNKGHDLCEIRCTHGWLSLLSVLTYEELLAVFILHHSLLITYYSSLIAHFNPALRRMVISHRLSDELVMDVQQPQHTGFIRPRLAAKANDVGEHDGR